MSNPIHVPRLLPDMSLALATLYSLPLPTGQERPSSHQAHEFLLRIQSRNLRRKIQSICQQQRDQNNPSAVPQLDSDGQEPILSMGSSWLPCIMILCHVHNGSMVYSMTERLFAAQTLLHRLRRTKMVDAIDIEIETPDITKGQALHFYHSERFQPNDLLLNYINWMKSINPHIAGVLESSHVNADDEERTKGEATLLTLACLSNMVACELQRESQSNPLLSTLGSTMAMAAMRLRFPSSPSTARQSMPIVAIIKEAFDAVRNEGQNTDAFRAALYSAIGMLPDMLLGSTGGTRGRLSMDPSATQAASQELRSTDVFLFWEILKQIEGNELGNGRDLWLLTTCERWARFVLLPSDLIQVVVNISTRYLTTNGDTSSLRRSAFLFLIAIFDAGTWTVEQVLAHSVGMSEQKQLYHEQKKRQSSRAKRRHHEKVESQTTDVLLTNAQHEVQERGEAACHAAMIAWDTISASVSEELLASRDGSFQGDGEGAIGCLAACATSCLPFLVRNPSTPHGLHLLKLVSDQLKMLCGSPNRAVRAQVFEPLYKLHQAAVQFLRGGGTFRSDLEDVLVDVCSKCALTLASSCPYPTDYFQSMSAPSDEDLETERNDIRDVVRALSGSGEGGSTSDPLSSDGLCDLSLNILSTILRSCSEAVTFYLQNGEIVPETIVHAFSALAKSLNHVARYFASGVENPDVFQSMFEVALNILKSANMMVLGSYMERESFAVSRTLSICTASLCPMLSSLLKSQQVDLKQLISQLVNQSIRVSMCLINHYPELPAQSNLAVSPYDIRGAMRGPGGEDHVGCLALMRMASESDELLSVLVDASKMFGADLCDIHERLKEAELARGFGVFHGRGVTPKSRRILLGVLSRISVASPADSAISNMLQQTFYFAVEHILSFSHGITELEEGTIYNLAETTFDLSAFHPSIASILVRRDHEHYQSTELCLKSLTNVYVQGYKSFAGIQFPFGVALQWNRLRASIFALLKTSGIYGSGATMLLECVVEECTAIGLQCDLGPSSTSPIFNEDIISPETVPAGLFVRLIGEKLSDPQMVSNCLEVIRGTNECILRAILNSCPEPHETAFTDPRPALCEAWLLTIVDAMNSSQSVRSLGDVLIETFCCMVTLLLRSSVDRSHKKGQGRCCMTMDGPHSLALMTFLCRFFEQGQELLTASATKIGATVPLDKESGGNFAFDSEANGLCIIGAALFRGVQGGLPPWAVESTPEVYRALYVALGRNPAKFSALLQVSMACRLAKESQPFGAVLPGHLLSGPFFQTLSDTAKQQFIDEAAEISLRDDTSSWKRFKAAVKHICGGKKKESDFGQKPAPTRWEVDRI